MIRSFRARAAADLFEGGEPRALWVIAAVARRKLDMLDAAARLDELRAPPGNRLERLRGDRDGNGLTTSGASAFAGRTARTMSRSWTTIEEMGDATDPHGTG